MEKRFSNISQKEGVCSGFAVKYNHPSFIDNIQSKEVFLPGSLKVNPKGAVLKSMHNEHSVLGNTLSKTLKIEEKPEGLFWECSIPKNALLERELLERGDLGACSLGFRCLKDTYKNGTRYIESAIVDEISLVNAGAHDQTQVDYRSPKPKGKYPKRNWADLL